MALVDAIIVAGIVTVVVAVALVITFSQIKPEDVGGAYKPCVGGWHEAILNNCAAGLTTIPQQPVNTYSNLAYLAAGVIVGLHFNTGPGYVFLFTMTFLAMGSALYHGLSTRWSGHWDVAAIYWVFGGVLIYSVGQFVEVGEPFTAAAMFFVAGIGAAFLRLILNKVDMALKVAVILAPIYVLEILYVRMHAPANGWLLLVLSFGLFLVAFIIWIADKRKWFWPQRWGHGLWHVLTGGAIPLLMFIYL